MKIKPLISVVFTAAILSFAIASAQEGGAERHASSFGFSIDMAPHWRILSSDRVKENPELLATLESDIFKGADKSIVASIGQKIRNGEVEIYFNTSTFEGEFYDNINVMSSHSTLPSGISEDSPFCLQIKGALRQGFGKSIELYSCRSTEVNGRNALYLDFDGIVDGTRSIQYHIALDGGITVISTLTGKSERIEALRSEYSAIMGTFEAK